MSADGPPKVGTHPERGLAVIHHEAYEVDIGPHVFPTAKYRLVLERLSNEGVIRGCELRRPEAASDEDVRRVHTQEWVRKLKEGDLTLEERWRLELPWSADLVRASWLCAGGAILCAHLALERGVAVHLGGGFHHAFAGHGEGFCALNDIAISLRALQQRGEIRRAAVVDLDVHQGNGTAAIFADDATVFTLSMHQERNYPFVKPPSNLDIGLRDGTGDDEYLTTLHERLPRALDEHRPELSWYLAGADPYREDTLGGLALSMAGLRERDETVLALLSARGIPVAVCLAGGYARRREDTVEIHCGTVRAAALASTARRRRATVLPSLGQPR